MRAAVVQMRSGTGRAANLEEAERLIRAAAADGARYVQTPEMTTVVDQKRGRLKETLAASEPDELGVFARLSEELGIALHIGSMALPCPSGEKFFNRGRLFWCGQELAHYDKVHLFDVDLPSGESWCESAMYEHGCEAVIAALPEVKIGLSVCYDLRFPALYRQLARGGAEVLTVPSAFTKPTGRAHWHVLLRARAIETGSFVLAAAQGGKHEDGRETYGHALIAAPWGEVVAELPHDEPGFVCADLDLAEVRHFRERIPSLSLERTPELRIYKA